jgi:hypothetical protein
MKMYEPIIYTRSIYYSWNIYFYDLTNINENKDKYKQDTIEYNICKLLNDLHLMLSINDKILDVVHPNIFLETDVIPFETTSNKKYMDEVQLFPLSSFQKLFFEEDKHSYGERERVIYEKEIIENNRNKLIFIFHRLEDLLLPKKTKLVCITSINNLKLFLELKKRGNVSYENLKNILGKINVECKTRSFCIYEQSIDMLMYLYMTSFELLDSKHDTRICRLITNTQI